MQANQPHINYSFEDIKKYFQGRMSTAEMHEMEKAALQDAFLADAIEGYKNSSLQQSQQDLEEIKNKILHNKQETKIIPFSSFKKQIWVAASVVGIILISSLFWLNNKNSVIKNNVAVTVPQQKIDSISITSQQSIVDSSTKIAANIPEKKKITQQKNAVVTNNNQPGAISNDEAFTSMNKPLFDTVKQLNETIVANGKAELSAGKDVAVLGKKMIAPLPSPASQALEGKVAGVDISNNTATKMFKIRGNAKANFITNQNNNITGRVVDAKGNSVAGASIILGNKSNVYTTNNEGYFNLSSKDSILNSTVAAIGYNSANQRLYKNKNNQIVLDENVSKLAEVVVVGYGSVKKKSITGSAAVIKNNESNELTPEGGWDNFKNYIGDELKKEKELDNINTHGTYKFKYEIDANNRLQKIKVLSSPNKKINPYFIKLLENGPKWQAPQKTSKKYKSSIQL